MSCCQKIISPVACGGVHGGGRASRRGREKSAGSGQVGVCSGGAEAERRGVEEVKGGALQLGPLAGGFQNIQVTLNTHNLLVSLRISAHMTCSYSVAQALTYFHPLECIVYILH